MVAFWHLDQPLSAFALVDMSIFLDAKFHSHVFDGLFLSAGTHQFDKLHGFR